MDIRSLSGPMKLSDILDTPSPLIRVNACMYEYMAHMCILVIALSNMPLLMLCMFPHGLYSLLDYEINLSYILLKYAAVGDCHFRRGAAVRSNDYNAQ